MIFSREGSPLLSFTNPWGLLGLLAVPAVLFLHLYRVRFAALTVGGLFLWDDAVRRPPGGRTRDRLRSTASLWCELLAALALALLLAGPRVRWETTAPHLVAVIDGSASMTATTGAVGTGGEPETFHDRALAELRRRAAAPGSDARLTVVRSGVRPRVVGGPRGPWRAVVQALADAEPPAGVRHDLAPAVDLAARLAADGGAVLVLTDRDPAAPGVAAPASAAVVGVGEPRPNVALAAADRTAADGDAGETGGEAVFVRARAFGAVGETTLTVTDAAGVDLHERRWRPEPGASAGFTLPLPARVGGESVTVRIAAAGDALAADSVATLLPTPNRPVRVFNALPPGPARDAVARAFAAVPATPVVGGEDEADLLFVTPDAAADRSAGTWAVAVGPLTVGSATAGAAAPPTDVAGPFLIDRADPLTGGLSLAGVVWGGAGGGRTLPGVGPVAPVAAAGDRVLVGRAVGDGGVFSVNADPARGTLARTPDWPILVANLLAARRAALPGPDRANLRLGETARLVPAPARAGAEDPLELVRLGENGGTVGESTALPREPVIPVTPPAAGLWAVRDGGAEVARFAVRLADAREADLTDLSAGVREADAEAAGAAVEDPAPWPVAALALVGLAAVVADWRATR